MVWYFLNGTPVFDGSLSMTGTMQVGGGLGVGIAPGPAGTVRVNSLTNTRMVMAGANGVLQDDAGLTYASGVLNVAANVATPANGSATARLVFGTTAGFGIYIGSGAPSVSAAQGSLYLRSNGTTTNDRIYVNNSSGSGTTWTAITTAA